MTKPDAFEEMVKKVLDPLIIECGCNGCMGPVVAKLLRQQHKKVRRIVQRAALTYGDMGTARAMKEEILAKLDTMAKGGKG